MPGSALKSQRIWRHGDACSLGAGLDLVLVAKPRACLLKLAKVHTDRALAEVIEAVCGSLAKELSSGSKTYLTA
jgi:hypothetical protein